MKDSILMSIALNSPFGIDEVFRCYENFKSYDLLISACLLAEREGIALLEIACLRTKGASSRQDAVRWTRVLPTAVGWYWCADGIDQTDNNLEVIRVFEDNGKFYAGSDQADRDPVGEYAEWWYGPLDPPRHVESNNQ